eukprot:365084-Chlamydomonas_euryale.AAC.16
MQCNTVGWSGAGRACTATTPQMVGWQSLKTRQVWGKNVGFDSAKLGSLPWRMDIFARAS